MWHQPSRVWVALWTVYLIWGSTYLGIKLAGETIPPIFAASIRFITAGTLMAVFVAWRRGPRLLLPGRKAFLSAAIVGVLLPSANGLLFVAERHVPTGTAALVIGSVPLLIVLLRFATGDPPKRRALVAVVGGFLGLAILVRPGGGTSVAWLGLVVCSALAWALGSFLSSRLPLPADAFAATALEMLVGGLFLLPFGLAFRGERVAESGGLLEPLDPRLGLPRALRLADGLHGLRLAARPRADRDGRHLCVRQPGGRDRARHGRSSTRRSRGRSSPAPR